MKDNPTVVFRLTVLALALASSVALSGCGGGGGGGISTPPTAPPTVPSGSSPTPAPSATSTASPTAPASGGTPTPAPAAPATYAPLFSAISTQVNSFTNTVNAQCAGASYPTKIYTELLPANANSVVNSLPGASVATVQTMASNAISQAVNLKQTLGISGVTLSINYPLLVSNPANLPNSTWSTANYATFLSYYQQVVQGLRAAGLGVNVETNIVFPAYVNVPFNYNGITVAMLESGVAEVAQHVVDNLHPDNVNLATEPSTIQYNTGLSAINDPVGYANYVSAIRSQVSTANSPTTKIGAGTDDWQSSSFTTNLLGVTSLDFYDYHLFPPDYLQAGITGLQQLRAGGKPLIITETWDDKEDVSVDGTTGPVDSQTVYVRGSYSFWGNVDAQYITSIVKLARCDNVQSVNIWDADHFYAYVDYNATSASYSFSQMQTQVNALLVQNQATGTITPAGYAMKQATGLAPASLTRR